MGASSRSSVVALGLQPRRQRQRAGRSTRAARRPGSPGRRSRSRPGCRRACGSRPTGSTCGPGSASAAGRASSSRSSQRLRSSRRRRRARRCGASSPAPISAASSTGSANAAARRRRTAPRRDRGCRSRRRRAAAAPRRGRGEAAARRDPRARVSSSTTGVSSPIDSSVPRPSRPRSARGHSKNVINDPGAPTVVAEVEVVAVRVVEVDRLLDEREAEPVAIEVERLLRVGADARDVVQPRRTA